MLRELPSLETKTKQNLKPNQTKQNKTSAWGGSCPGEVCPWPEALDLQRKGRCPRILVCLFSASALPVNFPRVLCFSWVLIMEWDGGLWWGFWTMWPRTGVRDGGRAAAATSAHTWMSDLLPLCSSRHKQHLSLKSLVAKSRNITLINVDK